MKTEFITWNALRSAEIKALNMNQHISKAVKADGGEIELMTSRKVMKLVRKRNPNSHKGSYGKLVIIAGSDMYRGAAVISTTAALRSGVGLIRVFSVESVCSALAVSAKSATLFPCPSDESGFVLPDERVLSELVKHLSSADAVLIGCGLGVTEGTEKLLETVINNARCPIIIDADGINLVYPRIELLRKAWQEVILTPHPAELARLCGVSLEEAIMNRFPLAEKLSKEYAVTVVAKSCASLILSDGKYSVSLSGNDGLSKGGSGDLLAGLIASFAAQHIAPYDCARLGVCVLGTACEKVSKRLSKTGMSVDDILDFLPKLFKKFERV